MAGHPPLGRPGCLEWQQKGLNPPPCVTNATDEYLAARSPSPSGVTNVLKTTPKPGRATPSYGFRGRPGRSARRIRRLAKTLCPKNLKNAASRPSDRHDRPPRLPRRQNHLPLQPHRGPAWWLLAAAPCWTRRTRCRSKTVRARVIRGKPENASGCVRVGISHTQPRVQGDGKMADNLDAELEAELKEQWQCRRFWPTSSRSGFRPPRSASPGPAPVPSSSGSWPWPPSACASAGCTECCSMATAPFDVTQEFVEHLIGVARASPRASGGIRVHENDPGPLGRGRGRHPTRLGHLGQHRAVAFAARAPRIERSAALASIVDASIPIRSPLTKPRSARRATTQANTASCASSGHRSRVRLSHEWSGTRWRSSSPRKARSNRLSAQRHSSPRSLSMPLEVADQVHAEVAPRRQRRRAHGRRIVGWHSASTKASNPASAAPPAAGRRTRAPATSTPGQAPRLTVGVHAPRHSPSLGQPCRRTGAARQGAARGSDSRRGREGGSLSP